jgi:hypothetical protein
MLLLLGTVTKQRYALTLGKSLKKAQSELLAAVFDVLVASLP